MRIPHIVMVGPSLDSAGGIASVVAVYKGGGLFERCNVLYIPSYKDGNLGTKLATALKGVCLFLSLVLRRRVSLVHVHSASRSSFVRKSVFILIALLARIKVVFQLHGGEFAKVYSNSLGKVSRAYVRFVLSRCARVIVLSERWRSILREIIDDDNVTAILNPVDPKSVNYNDVKRDPAFVLFLGRLEEKKGVFVLLDAVAKISSSNDFCLLLGGTGDRDSVSARIDQLGISEQVQLLGWIDGDEKRDLLSQATMLVLPSFAEGLPMSVLEAMASGTAVVTTPVGGIPDVVVDGVHGYLVPVGDVDQLAARMAHLLSHRSEAVAMGRAGHSQFQDTFNVEAVLPRIESIYSELGAIDSARL